MHFVHGRGDWEWEVRKRHEKEENRMRSWRNTGKKGIWEEWKDKTGKARWRKPRENNPGEEEVDRMVTQDELGRRRRDRMEFSPLHPSFSLILFSELFHSSASQRSSRGKSAPCSHSLLQMSLGCTQMNSSQNPYFTSTRAKHAKTDLWSSKYGPKAKPKIYCLI